MYMLYFFGTGRVVEVRALDRVFAVWRKSDGTPVCQDAFCLHLGANLAVGGKVKQSVQLICRYNF